MNILLIGFNHHTAPVAIREKLYVDDMQASALLASMMAQLPSISEAVVLSTCNRVELYCFVTDPHRAYQQVIEHLVGWFGMEQDILLAHGTIKEDASAIRHLMEVACGLDSMILGEPQILGQVGQAITNAQNVSASGLVLNRIFSDALHAGKRARTETAISEQTTSVSHVAALKVAESISNQDHPRIVVLGAGEMAEICVRALIHNDLTNIHLLNRTLERSQALAEQWGVTATPWSSLWDEIEHADAVVSAVAAPHTILQHNEVSRIMAGRNQRPLLLVDVAVPRNIETAVGAINGVNLCDIDDLQQVIDGNLAQRQACIPQVHSIIEVELGKSMAWLASRKVVPVIRDLREKVQAVVDGELNDVMHRLDHLNEADKAILERFAHRIVNKILHDPTSRLRERAILADSESFSQVVRDLFALDNLI